MKFRSFQNYLEDKEGNISSYLEKVAIATNKEISPIFKKINSESNLHTLSEEIAVIISDDYLYNNYQLNENSFAFNRHKLDLSNLSKDIGEYKHLPKKVNDIQKIKTLNFPIIASNNTLQDRYKTIGKLKASERIYKDFKEDIIPKTKFNILAFKKEPISIVEYINKLPLDVDINSFKMLDQVRSITSKIDETYSLDFYNIEVLESSKGKLYIKSVDRNLNLNPRESVLLYEKAYLEYNKRPIPNWVRNCMIKEYVIPYYESKQYDSMLIKSKHTINYTKYINA